jgi:hypothetical protein
MTGVRGGMTDWEKMYLHLFQETERAINILIEAQQQCEVLHITVPGGGCPVL